MSDRVMLTEHGHDFTGGECLAGAGYPVTWRCKWCGLKRVVATRGFDRVLYIDGAGEIYVSFGPLPIPKCWTETQREYRTPAQSGSDRT